MTKGQRKVLEFMSDYTAANGVPPTMTEIAAHVGVKQRSNIHRMLNSLINRGFVEKTAAGHTRCYFVRDALKIRISQIIDAHKEKQIPAGEALTLIEAELAMP
jgi:SOS-response transcriptional repressor LexA